MLLCFLQNATATAWDPRWYRLLQIFTITSVLGLLSYTLYPHYPHHFTSYKSAYYRTPLVQEKQRWHPVEELHQRAQQHLAQLLEKETGSLEEAEEAYIRRRGRRPPPGFDKWFQYAQSHGVILVEDFWDRIYDDIEPFWAITPSEIREQASKWIFRISVRHGKVSYLPVDQTDRVPWVPLWSDLISQISEDLPDLDMAINEMDEPRVVVPWEAVNKHVQDAAESKKLVARSDMIASYHNTSVQDATEVHDIDWRLVNDKSYWDLFVRGCHPDSAARKTYIATQDYQYPPPLERSWPKHSFHGYVQNWTLAKSPCDYPTLQELHGSFIEPLTISTTDKLLPIFGGSKVFVNNELLLPAAMYWSEDAAFSAVDRYGDQWTMKHDKAVWRGSPSGGRHRKTTWTRLQRPRLVGMLNGSNVQRAFQTASRPPMFALPEEQPYELSSVHEGEFGSWLSRIADTAFTEHVCIPSVDNPDCSYVEEWYNTLHKMPMEQQFQFKYLPDVDGNSFSGRYRALVPLLVQEHSALWHSAVDDHVRLRVECFVNHVLHNSG